MGMMYLSDDDDDDDDDKDLSGDKVSVYLAMSCVYLVSTCVFPLLWYRLALTPAANGSA